MAPSRRRSEMAKKGHKPEEAVAKLRQVDVPGSQGRGVAGAGPGRGAGGGTAKKGHKPEEAVAKLRQVDVPVSQGRSVAEAVRAIGATEVTYYRRRREFGGLKSDQVKRLKELEAENARLRRAVSALTLAKQSLHGAARADPSAPRD